MQNSMVVAAMEGRMRKEGRVPGVFEEMLPADRIRRAFGRIIPRRRDGISDMGNSVSTVGMEG